MLYQPSLGGGEAHGVPAEIVDGDEFAEEGVADNPEWADGCGDVHAGERGDTGAAGVEDVVCAGKGVGLPAKGESEIGKGGDGVAVDRVLAVPRFSCADPESTSVLKSEMEVADTYSLLSSSATSVGMTIKLVPVSMAAPVFSNSSSSSPKPMLSSSTSQ